MGMDEKLQKSLTEQEELYDYIYKKDNKYGISGYRIPILSRAVASLPRKHVTSVLDIGAGRGQLLNWFKKHYNPEVLAGVEISKKAIKKSRRAKWIKHGSAQQVPFDDSSFNVVVCTDVLEHVPPNELGLCLDEMLRVGRKWWIVETDNGKAREDKHLRKSPVKQKTLHLIRKDINWWMLQFQKHGFNVRRASKYYDSKMLFVMTRAPVVKKD
tara:strand:- start:127671 stop:128309 length:639 start_codon:yes stop_codon:yes gene_type:complete